MLKKFCFVVFLLLSLMSPAWAISVIRDTETESLLLGYIRSIFGAGGLNPQNAEVVIVNDPSINAFVAGGQTIFIHTGLIVKVKHPDDLIFVLSHETGHIVGGHIVRGYQALQNAQTTALISSVLGGVLAVAGGRPDAGIALMIGGQSSAMGLFTKYRQTEESAADRIAADIVGKLGYSMGGFSEVMKFIKAEERLNGSPDSYLRTHPLTQTRVEEMSHFLQNIKPFRQDEAFDLVRAKLIGFLWDPNRVLSDYRGDTLPDLYARSIALYRRNRFQEAFKVLDELISLRSDNPYFHELKGQFLFETGQLSLAEESYQTAYRLKSAPLIALSYAQVLLEEEGSDKMVRAEELLKNVLHQEPEESLGWRLLARAYDRQGKISYAEYAMAEYDRSRGALNLAQKRAERLKDSFPNDLVVTQRLRDILELSEPE